MFENFLGFSSNWEVFAKQDFYGTVKRRLVESPNEYGEMLVALVRANTPELTGALYESIDYQPDPDDGDMGMVKVFANPLIQMAQWGRQYDVYQEGGLLGLPTYTNPPHEMFYKALHTTDAIVALSQKIADRGINDLVGLKGDFMQGLA